MLNFSDKYAKHYQNKCLKFCSKIEKKKTGIKIKMPHKSKTVDSINQTITPFNPSMPKENTD